MPEARSFQCPDCGSSVQTDGSQKEVKCEYCGATVIVPEELRDQPAPAPAPVFSPAPPMISADAANSIGAAAKVTAGAALASFALPIILTCLILGFVGAVLFFAFSSVNKSIASINTSAASSIASAVAFATSMPALSPTSINTPAPFTKVLLKDNFTNPSSGWNTTRNSDYTLEYKNGKYHVLIKKQGGGQALWLGSKFTDMSVEADVQQTAGPTDGEIGVACRVSDSGGFYSFELTQDGLYGIYKSTNWTSDPLVEGNLNPNTLSPASVTHIEGVCVGNTLTLLLNGKVMLQTQDSDYKKGGAGLIVATSSSGAPGVDVLFSNFLAKGP